MKKKNLSHSQLADLYDLHVNIPNLIQEFQLKGDFHNHLPIEDDDMEDNPNPNSTNPGYIIHNHPAFKLGNINYKITKIQVPSEEAAFMELEAYDYRWDSCLCSLVSASWKNALAQTEDQLRAVLPKYLTE